jgi:hypothetical protein
MMKAWLVENDIVTNIGLFNTEEDAENNGYVILDFEGANIGDNISDLDALREARRLQEEAEAINENEVLWPIWGIREKRDKLLAETDWWASSDLAPMSAERVAYRQALRNLPSVVLAREPDEILDGEDAYCNIPFPVKPE